MGEFLRRKDEDKGAFIKRMAAAMAEHRRIMSENDEKGYLGRTPKFSAAYNNVNNPPLDPGFIQSRHYNHDLRLAIDRKMKDRGKNVPTVGISNRPGYGFDKGAFEKNKGAAIVPSSLPPKHDALPQVPKLVANATEEQIAEYAKIVEAAKLKDIAEALAVQLSRGTSSIEKSLGGVDGIYIPGGQDNVSKDPADNEKSTREAYEIALVEKARLLGMPILSVCGGSRSFARGFGVGEQPVTGSQKVKKVHKAGLDKQAHGLYFSALPDQKDGVRDEKFYGLIGGAVPQGEVQTVINKISGVNSTHEKVIHHVGEEPVAKPIRITQSIDGKKVEVDDNRKINNRTELMITAWDNDTATKSPEGFETRYGAPMMGITSHPELITGSASYRPKFEEDAQKWSDNIFKVFAQSMMTYAEKKKLIADIHEEIKAGKIPKIK